MTDDTEWDPGQKYRTLLSQIRGVLDDGEERTVRGVYYALESHGHEWEYRKVKRAVKKGRRAGFIDPAQIIDTSRSASTVPGSGWDDPQDYIDRKVEGIWNDYWENFWDYQDSYVEVWVEKQALESVFEPICRQNAVRLECTRGDWSDSKVYRATDRIKDKLLEGLDVTVLYFGDFNPSGFHAPVSILERMGHYGLELTREFPGSSHMRYYDSEWSMPRTFTLKQSREEVQFDFQRCAINIEHIKRFDLTENPVPSGTDKDAQIKRYFREYVSEGRDTNVELDALKEFEREFLEGLIQEKIDDHHDADRREQVRERIQAGREVLDDAIEIDDSRLMDAFDPPIERND